MNKIDCRPVVVGSRVVCALHYCGAGIVFAVHGESRPSAVRVVMDDVGVQGGSARYDVVFDNGSISYQVPESILRGLQWTLSDEVASAEDIAAALAHSAIVTAQSEAATQQRQSAHAATIAQYKTDPAYKHLSQGDDCYSGKLAAKNIRAALRQTFKGVKFSVRVESYGSVGVRWEDGPTAAAIEEVTGKYQAGSFNGMEDIYEYEPSAWNEIFGGAKFLSVNRSYSVELIEKAITETFRQDADTMKGVVVPTVEDYVEGRLWYISVPGRNYNLQSLIFQTLGTMAG